MKVILLQNSTQLLAGSTGVKEQLINTEVPGGWSRDFDNLDNLDELQNQLMNLWKRSMVKGQWSTVNGQWSIKELPNDQTTNFPNN